LIIADYRQDPGGGRTRGWAIFGVLSCMYRNSLIFNLYSIMQNNRIKPRIRGWIL